MKESLWVAINEVIAFLANWFEVIGFLVAVITAIKVFFISKEVKKLSAKHLFASRIDEHLVDFKKTSKFIAGKVGDYRANLILIKNEISQCLANCRSLKKKVHKSESATLLLLIRISKKITRNKHNTTSTLSWFDKVMRRKPVQEVEIIFYYQTLTMLIKEIEHLNKDIKKSL